ncbi:D-alanyl-D-alanine carboxypeptidase DacB precursor [mine drainage metagenome]|uniref:D-alanyl-D-alanine carboxypeptidase DacB n=1 Tax=mine drainage metagenome TaxID=410659 RepID=A0A1J5R4E7_9ZZZZ
MKHTFPWLAALALLGAALTASAGLPPPVRQALHEAGIPEDAVSVFVQRVDHDTPLIAHQADQALNPASTMKLVTTYAGLELLGPAYTWHTDLVTTGTIEGGTLKGDLILKGYGDPAMTLENFWDLVRALRQSGIREIDGNLVLDRSYFEAQSPDPAAFDDEPYRAYNAGPDAMLVNFKATRFNFRGDAATGRVIIEADPALPQLGIDNHLSLGRAPCNGWKDHLGYQVAHNGSGVNVSFGGSYSIACGEKSLDLSLFDDTVYVFELFRQLWREQGGSFNGHLELARAPDNARLLVRATSPPLADVIRLINKYSNNVMARQLLLTIGAEKTALPGSIENGAQAIRTWLAAKHLDFPELVITNGAGLSREARISPRHLGALLLTAWASPVMPELVSSLPVIAVDGTMEHRMKTSSVAGRGHFKTGSLDGTRAMAGYLLDAKNRRWVVVFMINHPRAAASRAAQDALLEWLYNRD